MILVRLCLTVIARPYLTCFFPETSGETGHEGSKNGCGTEQRHVIRYYQAGMNRTLLRNDVDLDAGKVPQWLGGWRSAAGYDRFDKR